VSDLGEAPAATNAAKPSASANADEKTAASALAAEIIREAQAGSVAADAANPTARPAAARPAAQAAARETPDDTALREWAKAAMTWLKESVPWLRKDEADERPHQGGVSDQVDWNESGLAGGNTGRGGRGDGVTNAGTPVASAGPYTSVGYGSGPGGALLPQNNLIQEFIDAVRTVLEHPMTWLVVALFVIGGIAVRKFDRRPTK
jgi:hypothetical protein